MVLIPKKTQVKINKNKIKIIIGRLIKMGYSFSEISKYTKIHRTVLSAIKNDNPISISLEKSKEYFSSCSKTLVEIVNINS